MAFHGTQFSDSSTDESKVIYGGAEFDVSNIEVKSADDSTSSTITDEAKSVFEFDNCSHIHRWPTDGELVSYYDGVDVAEQLQKIKGVVEMIEDNREKMIKDALSGFEMRKTVRTDGDDEETTLDSYLDDRPEDCAVDGELARLARVYPEREVADGR